MDSCFVGVAYETKDKWVTRSSNFGYYLNASGTSSLKETGNTFIFAYIHGAGNVTPTDISLTNFRLVKKVNIRKKQI